MAGRAAALSLPAACHGLLAATFFLASQAKAGDAWHHLTATQVKSITTTLSPTHLRPAAPAYLPAGFRVTRAEADASIRYANGDADPGFSIEYRGPENRCFMLSENKGGSRGLQQIKTIQSRIGLIAVYRDPHATAESRNSLTAFLPAEASIMLRTPSYGDENPDGSFIACQPIPLPEFLKVAGSLRWLSP